MTDNNTNSRIRNFAFLWDTWTNQFFIPCSPTTPRGTVPEDWFSLDESAAAGLPPLGALTAYLQIFNNLDSTDTDRVPRVLGTVANVGGVWRRTPLSEEELTEVAAAGGEAELTPAEEEVHEDIRCSICYERPVSIQFRECTHAVCAVCNDKYWWILLSDDTKQGRGPTNALRLSFPCHLCRAEIYHEGHLVLDSNLPVQVTHGDFGFQVRGWHLVALAPGFKFHMVFVVRVEERGERVTAEPLMRRERPVPLVDGGRLAGSWGLYVVYALAVLCTVVDASSG